MSDEEGGMLAEKSEKQMKKGADVVEDADKGLSTMELLGIGEDVTAVFGAMLGPLGTMAGGFETREGMKQMEKGDGNGAVTALKGIAGMVGGTGSSLAGTAAAMGYEGAALGAIEGAGPLGFAGGAGLALGTGLNAIANSDATKTGFWGHDADSGKDKSAGLAAADLGISANRALGLDDGNFLGAQVSMAAGVETAMVAPFQAAANLTGQAIDSASGTASILGNSFSQLVGGTGRPGY